MHWRPSILTGGKTDIIFFIIFFLYQIICEFATFYTFVKINDVILDFLNVEIM